MVLWASRWACMLFSPYLSWYCPPNSKTFILLSTSLSTFRSNARFCSATFPLFAGEILPRSPVIPSSLSSSGWSPFSSDELLRRPPPSSTSPVAPPAPLSFASLAAASLSFASLAKSSFVACSASSSSAPSFLIFQALLHLPLLRR